MLERLKAFLAVRDATVFIIGIRLNEGPGIITKQRGECRGADCGAGATALPHAFGFRPVRETSMTMTSIQQRADALWRDARGAVDALIAELAAQNVMVRQPPTVLRIHDTGIDVLRRDVTREELVLRVAGRPAEAVKHVVETMGAGLGKDCALEIGPGLILASRIILPAESDDILRAIVRNKVESIAPWPLPQSLYGQRIEAVPGDAAHVAVDVGVVSRALARRHRGPARCRRNCGEGRVASAAVRGKPADRLRLGRGKPRRAAPRDASCRDLCCRGGCGGGSRVHARLAGIRKACRRA